MNRDDLELFGTGGTVLGAIVGLGLSFTSLSPLAIGGIVGCAFSMMLVVIFAGRLLCALYIGKESNRDSHKTILYSAVTITAAAVGGAIGTVANLLFPGVMSKTLFPDVMSICAVVLVGSVIGAIGTISALLVGEYIINPTVEKVTQCFSKESHI